jgi:hypothetical protein
MQKAIDPKAEKKAHETLQKGSPWKGGNGEREIDPNQLRIAFSEQKKDKIMQPRISTKPSKIEKEISFVVNIAQVLIIYNDDARPGEEQIHSGDDRDVN